MATRGGPSNRRRGGFSWSAVLLQGLAVCVFAAAAFWERGKSEQAWQEHLAQQAAIEAGREPVFARGEFPAVYELCSSLWRDELLVYHEPSALAWTRSSLDGFFVEGADARSWRRLRCSAAGVERGPRVARPLLEDLPAEESQALDEVAQEAWRAALAELAHTPLEGQELAVEVVRHPGTGQVIRRRWGGFEAGLGPRVEPPGAPTFPNLIDDAALRPPSLQAPPPIAVLPVTSWVKKPDAAFDRLARSIPEGAGIVELTLTETAIEIAIEAPTRALNGSGPYPYGSLSFDEHGVASSSQWRSSSEPPGFGCDKGRTLAIVRSDFHQAWKNRGKIPFHRAWYSCSPAYSDQIRGAWHLDTD